MHVVNQENYSAALDAIRDVLLMYVQLADDGCMVHGAEYSIRFDPLLYVDAVQSDERHYFVDVDLLRAGSALAVVAKYHSVWCEEYGVHAWEDTGRYAEAVLAGRFRHLPRIDAVLLEHLKGQHAAMDDPWFDEVTAELCKRLVRPYFARLAEGGESGRGPADWVTLT